jgi:hypothetical protein
MSRNDWSRSLSRVIATRDGKRLRTLADASGYVLALPHEVQARSYWHKAAMLVLDAATGGDVVAASDHLVLALILDGQLDADNTPVPDRAEN